LGAPEPADSSVPMSDCAFRSLAQAHLQFPERHLDGVRFNLSIAADSDAWRLALRPQAMHFS
jgi:hypothetical protein